MTIHNQYGEHNAYFGVYKNGNLFIEQATLVALVSYKDGRDSLKVAMYIDQYDGNLLTLTFSNLSLHVILKTNRIQYPSCIVTRSCP